MGIPRHLKKKGGMASSSYAMEDARRHLRKEEFDLIYPPNSNGSSGTSSKVPIATMYGGRHQSRDASDYYEYYPKCIRPFLPKVLFISICPLMISLCLIPNSACQTIAACGEHDDFV